MIDLLGCVAGEASIQTCILKREIQPYGHFYITMVSVDICKFELFSGESEP